jgi:hypothetical protein
MIPQTLAPTKNRGARYVSVSVRIGLFEKGRANFKDFHAREIECIPNTVEEAEELYTRIDAIMQEYGHEKTGGLEVKVLELGKEGSG